MALVLAIEPDLRQASILKRIVREKVRAQLVLVESRDAAISAIDAQIPDVILVTALLSPRDEEELVAHLKTLEGAEHLQTHTIPQLASVRAEADSPGGGLFGKFRRKKESEPIPGCDPDMFGEEISTFLDRASQLKAEALAALHHRVAELEAERPAVRAPRQAPQDPAPGEPVASGPATAPSTPAPSSWASPFEWRRESPAPAARDKKAEGPAPVVTRPLVAHVPLAVIADEEQRRAEEEAERRRVEEAARQREEQERRRKEDEERRRREEEARAAREREEAERRRKEAEAKAARERQEAERRRKEEEARLERERQERERLAREEAERKRKEAEARAARERQEREEAERRRLEAQARAARERQEREEAERKRKEAEARAARERQEREEAERKRKEAEARAARERQEREEAERRRLEAQARAERERREREEAARRRLEAEARAERERREREEAERLRLEAEAEAERAERERLEREAAERERIAAAERAARQKAEAEAAARARQTRRKVAAAVKQYGGPPALVGLSKPPDGADRYAEFRDGYDEFRSGVLRLVPLAMWARAERQPATDRSEPTSKDDLQAIMSRLSMPPQVAGVYYPRGCRIRRVRVPAGGAAPRKYAKPLIVSRKALDNKSVER